MDHYGFFKTLFLEKQSLFKDNDQLIKCFLSDSQTVELILSQLKVLLKTSHKGNSDQNSENDSKLLKTLPRQIQQLFIEQVIQNDDVDSYRSLLKTLAFDQEKDLQPRLIQARARKILADVKGFSQESMLKSEVSDKKQNFLVTLCCICRRINKIKDSWHKFYK